MATAARTSFSHYDTLQVRPSASDEEIERAFATQMRVFRLRADNPLVHLARLNTAYRTLRDPRKRSAYDAAIGVERTSRSWAPNDAGAIAAVQWVESRDNSVLAAETKLPERTAAEPGREMRFASFIAQFLRQPATEPVADVPSDPSAIAEQSGAPAGIEESRSILPLQRIDSRGGHRSARPTPLLLGAAVAGLSMLAISLAVIEQHKGPALEKSQASTITRLLPPPSVAEDAAAQPSAGGAVGIEPAAAKPAGERPAIVTRVAPAVAEAPATEVIPSGNDRDAAPLTTGHDADLQSSPPTSTEAPTDAAPVVASSARLPLPNSTISRTIGHIGYACGEVVSITAAEGSAPDVYNVHCSSGDNYRATPLAGRYHFRRLAPASSRATATSDAAPAQNSGNEP